MATKIKFDPTEHLIRLGGKDYLQVQHRVLWFRAEHPKGRIETELINVEPLIYKATIIDSDGHILATGHGSAQRKDKAIWNGREVEKAETAAIGRALGLAGFGTQFTDDFSDGDDNHLADSPTTPKSSQSSPQKRETTPNKPNTHNGATNSQNGHSDDLIENGATDTAILKSLTVVEKDGRNRLKFTTTDNRTVLAFSRKLFLERGWCDETEWMELGAVKLDANIPVGITHHLVTTDEGEIKGGYWEVSSVSEVSFDDAKAS
jgi:hypothetical protein